MGAGPSPSPTSAETRARRAKRIAHDVLQQRLSGIEVDEEAILAAHADLTSELKQELQWLRQIGEATEAAQQRRQQDTGRATTAVSEAERRMLSEALPALEDFERLESGGQGVVFRAWEAAACRYVAIKILLNGPLTTPRQHARFEREVELIGQLSHPNIVPLYSSGCAEDRPYLIMEYINGLPIEDHVGAAGMDVRQVVKLFVTVCKAVGHAHQRGIIHRDLKPTNVLVDADGEPHVLDFGLAKDAWLQDANEALTLTGEWMGTLQFTSPEQAEGRLKELDVRSDVYSLGVLLFRLITGMFPYPVVGDPATIRRHITTTEPMRLRQALRQDACAACLGPDLIDDDLEQVIRKAIAKEQERRYAAATALAEDLERWLKHEAVDAKADSAAYVLRKTLRKYRVPIVVAAGFGILLLASVVAIAISLRTATQQRNNARSASALAVRTLSRTLSELEQGLRGLAGGTQLRDTLLAGVSTDIEELRELVESDETMAGVEADLLAREGDLALARGETEVAARAYQAALQAHGRPGAPSPSLGEARIRAKLAGVSSNYDEHYRMAIPALSQLLDRAPQDATVRAELCRALVDYAQRLYTSGRHAESASATEQAIDLSQAFGDGEPTLDQIQLKAEIRERHADAIQRLGEGKLAIECLQQARGILWKAIDAHPSNVELRNEFVRLARKLGRLHIDAGEDEAALTLLNEGVEHGSYLVQADASVALWKYDLLGLHDEIAWLHIAAGDLDRALQHADLELQLAEELRHVDSEAMMWRNAMACALSAHGEIMRAQGNVEAARDELGRAREIREALQSAQPENRTLMAELACVYDLLAACQSPLSDPAALTLYERARDLRVRLSAIEPENVEHKVRVILSMTNLASWHMRQRTSKEDGTAAALLLNAREHLTAMLGRGELEGRDARYRRWLTAVDQNLAIIERRAQQLSSQ